MKRPELRRIFQGVALVAAPLAGCSDECGLWETLTVTVPASSPLCNSACPDYFNTARVHTCSYDQELDGGPRVIDGGVSVRCWCCNDTSCGRRPAGLRPALIRARGEVGKLFAEMAHLEAASVPAFQRLAIELTAHRAPSGLVLRALQSARDEQRHSVAVGGLAQRFGGELAPVEVDEFGVRPLESIAAENAAEGCVREAYGALTAAWMANAANDRDVRAAFAGIAADELRHAELSWEIAAWAGLPSAAHEKALESLRLSVAVDPPAGIRDAAGLPSAEQAFELWCKLRG